jgi:Amt family ammonium transporter
MPDGINAADTVWVLLSTALVMLMTPALGFFYAGLVRRKNVLATIMHSFFMLCLVSVQWMLFGYSLAFGPSVGGLIGGLQWAGLEGVGMAPNPDYAATIPHQVFMLYQMMFAVITPALITGAFAERKRFKAFAIFSLLWATLVYAPAAHWVWGAGGWLKTLGALDFAGGIVVHVSAGFAALVAAMVIGKRDGVDDEPIEPHDATMTMLGTGLLWFGWFGFNAGSALAVSSVAVSAMVATNASAAMAALAWLTVSWIHKGQPSTLGSAIGAVAGLAAVTPAVGYVTPSAALVIGLVAGVVCYGAVQMKSVLKVDDALDVWACHGVGGVWGSLAIGLFATKSVNEAGANGLFYGGGFGQLGVQALAIVAVAAFSVVATFVILKLVGAAIGLRVHLEAEQLGLDASQHGEVAYQL